MTPAAHRPAGASGAAWLALLAVALLAATGAHAGVSPDSALARTGGVCASEGSTLVQTRSVRIYSKRGVKVACHRRSGRRTVFTDPVSVCDACLTNRIRTAATMVAYDLSYTGRRGVFYNLQVLNAKTGRIIRDIFQGEFSSNIGIRREARLADLEVRANGSIVWISDVREYDALNRFVQTYEVRRADTAAGGSTNVLLDSSPEIDPTSLTLDGLRAHWARGGERVSAPVR